MEKSKTSLLSPSNSGKNLKIYTASAGSGKTYTLTRQYLKLLLSHPERYYFSTILAVTFTNKATAEMKSRIISELYKLSISTDPDETAEFCRPAGNYNDGLNYSTSHEEVKKRAADRLSVMLQDYSSFHVQTIDSFFQEVVRSFAFENALNGGFGIELDSKEVIESSVQSLMNRIGDSSTSSFSKWLKERYLEKFNDQESLTLFKDLKELAHHILYSESMEPFVNQLEDPNFSVKIDALRLKLKSCMQSYEDELKNALEDFYTFAVKDKKLKLSITSHSTLEKVAAYGTGCKPSDLRNLITDPKGFGSYFDGMMKGGNLYSAEKKNDPDAKKIERCKYDILNHLRIIYNLLNQDRRKKEYITAFLILKHLDLWPALAYLISDINEYCKENNIMLISDINKQLREIIQDTSVDVPFVYDKIGTYVNHYMIDEMQDTSPIQWTNFKPLLLDSLASGKTNLMVGDVKQSIYRFRGTDSSLLGQVIPNDSDIKHYIEPIELKTNWRSFSEIIDFNNKLFVDIFNFKELFPDAKSNTEVYENYYKSAEQEVSPAKKVKREGEVTIDVFPYMPSPRKKKNDDDEEEKKEDAIVYDDYVRKWLYDKLSTLQTEQHYSPSQIAILVRKGTEGVKVAAMLADFESDPQKPEHLSFTFLSDEALLISNSIIVKLLASMVRAFAYPADPNTTLELKQHLHRFYSLINQPFRDSDQLEQLMDKIREIQRRGLSVFETVSNLLQLITNPNEGEEGEHSSSLLSEWLSTESPYINAYLDAIYELSSKQTLTFYSLAEWWERYENKAMISMGESNNGGIRIITIHKAKGLEFLVVLMPYAAWKLQRPMLAKPEFSEHKPNQAKPIVAQIDKDSTDLFDTFKYYLIPVSSNLLPNSYFSHTKSTLDLLDYMDSLNLLYVAFTRAGASLHLCFNENSLGKTTWKMVQGKVGNIDGMTEDHETFTGKDCNKKNDKEIEITKYRKGQPVIKSNENQNDKSEAQDIIPLEGLFASPRYDKFFLSQKVLNDIAKRDQHRKYGIVMHEILSNSRDLESFTSAVNKAVHRRQLTEKEGKEAIDKFTAIIREEPYSKWFNSDVDNEMAPRHFVEQSIITKGRVYRPDLVIDDGEGTITVVDYKFGEHTPESEKKYRRQIANYMHMLKRAGFRNIKGYIWFNLEKLLVV